MRYFGLSIQDGHLPADQQTRIGEQWFGPRGLLQWLERQLGLEPAADDRDYLRPEQYRQVLKLLLHQYPEAFFAQSFAADDLGTATALLAARDELVGAGWNFQIDTTLPRRLKLLAEAEAILARIDNTLRLYPGEADRWAALITRAEAIVAFLPELQLVDERQILPPHLERLLTALEEAGMLIYRYQRPATVSQSDLGQWQAFLNGGIRREELQLRADGSLLLLRAFRETHSAAYLAKLLRQNPDFRPAVLLPQPKRTLDNAFLREGLPSMGVPSASLARPSLQVLKLATVFLWEPLDLHKIMEFVSLAVKPLEAGLAQRIAAFLAETPGLFSDRWFGMIKQYLEVDLPAIASKRKQLDPEQIAREYRFWFARQRVDSRSGRVPKAEVRQIYQHLHLWAKAAAEDAGGSMLVLANQSQQIVELLDTLPETELSSLELERVIRTIYQPAPHNFQPPARNSCPVVHHPGAIIGDIDELIWWDFIEHEPNYFFSRWYPTELRALRDRGVELESPRQENQRLVVQRRRPVHSTRKRLLLCLSDYTDGQAAEPHALYGDLAAAFGEEALDQITLQLDSQHTGTAWLQAFQLPAFTSLKPNSPTGPRPFLQLRKSIELRETETPTSLETLLYYPYQWIFRHHIKLRQSSILSVVDDNRLFGKLAHRLLEQLLAKDFQYWEQERVYQWVQGEIPRLLRKEGATLLQYGREPELIAFTKYMKFAAWSLIDLLKRNEWMVDATEKELEGKWEGCLLRGRADLVLSRGRERAIVDLKWRGKTRYGNLLRSREDIQLALYAKLLRDGQDSWPHTAFFIIEQAQMLVRNTQAFRGLAPVQEEADHQEIYEELTRVLAKTFRWRLAQLRAGQVEIRCRATVGALEDTYGEQLMDVLEMKQDDAYFDDYQVLIGLIR
jgi:hypothetical protein